MSQCCVYATLTETETLKKVDSFYLIFHENPVNINHHCVKSVQIRSFFLVRIFPHSDRIRIDTDQKIRENTGQKKLRIWTLFTQRVSSNHRHISQTMVIVISLSTENILFGKIWSKKSKLSV